MHHSWWNDPLMVIGLHEYRPICRFEASAVKAMRPNPHTWLLCPVNFWILYTLPFTILVVLCPNTLLSLLRCDVYHGVEVDILEDERLEQCLLHARHPGIIVPILSSRRILSFSVIRLCSWMYWHGIAAAAAAAAAAFRGSQVLPASWRQRFPDARLKIHLRFNVVRILCTILVLFHGWLGRFAKVFFLFAQWWTIIHNPRFVKTQIRHSGIFNDGTCTGGWFWLHSRNISLMTTVNHFGNDCPNLKFLPLFPLHRSSLEVRVQLIHLGFIISTLEIALAKISRMYLYWCPHLRLLSRTFSGMYSYFWMWRMSINATKWTSLTLCFCVPSLWPPFIPFPLSPFHLEPTLFGMKYLLFVLLGFPRHASLRDRSPESSEPYVTLDSRSSLIRTTFGFHASFFSVSHLRASRTPLFF